MNVIFKVVSSQHLDQMPIVNGQLIILKDKESMFYDIDDKRHPVKSTEEGRFVFVDTEQTITGVKTFTGQVQINQLTQGQNCTATNLSHAEGKDTAANGKYSHSQGEGTNAEGDGSAASGKDSNSVGDYSSANGVSTTALGEGSFSAGLGTTANDPYSAAFGIGNDPKAGDLFEIGNGNIIDSNGNPLPEAQQTFSNAFRVTKDGKAIVETDVELESGIQLSNREAVGNKVTSISSSATDTQYPSALAVKKYVDALPEPMIFKGTLGTGGTITSLPTAAASNQGFTYKVITAGTYADEAAKVGDTFISTGSKWERIPSGDEPSGTVTNVAATASNGVQVTGGPITSSGTLTITGVLATQSANGMMSSADKTKLDGMFQVHVGTTAPSNSLGKNGDIYIMKI